MKTIQLRMNGNTKTVNVHSRVCDALTAFDIEPELPVIGALHNNFLKGLNASLSTNGDLQAIRLDSSLGHRIYRKSLCFLLNLAAQRIFSTEIPRISHSLGDAYFFYLPGNGSIGKSQIQELKAEMQKLVQADLPIQPQTLSFQQALDVFDKPSREETRQLIQQGNQRKVNCQECDGFFDLDHFPLVPRTGMLSTWDIMQHKHGLVLQFPPKDLPLSLQPLHEKPLLFSIFQEYNEWGRILGVPNLPQLNQLAKTEEIGHFIAVAEALHDKKLSALADQIAAKRDQTRIVLIAGPSSSGKTTFSKKLAIHLEVVGFRPRVISLDNYFVPRHLTPRDENGEYNFEALEAIDIALLNEHLLDLANGKEVELPIFDFKIGGRKESGIQMKMEPNDIIVMEGIHGLNPALLPRIPKEQIFKIYISALTQLNIDTHNRISTTDNRLIRRIVRDAKYRGYSAELTLQRWPSVRRGESENIFPFQESADAFFNSALDYELSVLGNYALPLLRDVSPCSPEFAQAAILIDFLQKFHPILPEKVPRFSLLREFIGGSGFSY